MANPERLQPLLSRQNSAGRIEKPSKRQCWANFLPKLAFIAKKKCARPIWP